MANTNVLEVEARSEIGSRKMKRLRASGKIPAILYGAGKENVNLTIARDALAHAVEHGAHLVQLAGAASETALIRDLQWDMMGNDIVHVDLTRAKATDLVDATLAIELRGEAPGARSGGIVEQPIHTISLNCPAGAIPEKLVVNVNELGLGDAITAGDLDIPDGAELRIDEAAVIVHCVEPREEIESEAGADAAEPEIIGRSAEDGDGDSAD